MGMMAWPLKAVVLANRMVLFLQQVSIHTTVNYQNSSSLAVRRVWLMYSQLGHCYALTASSDAGDTVGALLNRTTRTISFIKNGLDLGAAFNNVNESLLYPSVGMRTPEEEVCLKTLPSSILSLAYDMPMCKTVRSSTSWPPSTCRAQPAVEQ